MQMVHGLGWLFGAQDLRAQGLGTLKNCGDIVM
jgi:hypothetical protein